MAVKYGSHALSRTPKRTSCALLVPTMRFACCTVKRLLGQPRLRRRWGFALETPLPSSPSPVARRGELLQRCSRHRPVCLSFPTEAGLLPSPTPVHDIQTDRHRKGTHAGRQTGRQTDRQTEEFTHACRFPASSKAGHRLSFGCACLSVRRQPPDAPAVHLSAAALGMQALVQVYPSAPGSHPPPLRRPVWAWFAPTTSGSTRLVRTHLLLQRARELLVGRRRLSQHRVIV
jgi:hypothetical protein